MIAKFNVFMIPPLLSLAIGLSLTILSIVKGKFRKENILFSLVCIWWSCLLPPIFIAHHLFKGDEALILSLERVIHFFFVYFPVVLMAYLNNILKLQKNYLIWITAGISFVISLFTTTEYYISGLYSYNWGYMAKGGIVFNIFGVYGMIVTAYLAVVGSRKLRTETNYIMKIKIKYIFLSLMASAFMTMGNLPAINGIDLYPVGNLSFIPLGIMAYGVLRFRLMDIRSILHLTVVWVVVSSLVIVPNIFLLIYFWPAIIRLGINEVILIAIGWFVVNYVYMWKVQPFIDQLFNKRKFNLNLVESEFIEEIAHLRSYDDLLREFTDILRKTLSFTDFHIIRRNEESGSYVLKSGESINLSGDIKSWFLQHNDLVNRSLVETDPIYLPIRKELSELFRHMECDFILPFIHNEKIIGIITMPERANLQQLTLDEMRFVNNLKNSVLIALLNSLMYQDLTNYKNNLELMVDERTMELKKSHVEIEAAMQTIRELAIRDELTGMFNRRHLMGLIDDEKNRASRGGGLFCLAMLDIDHFKSVNDMHGHLTGDAVLRAIASTIQTSMRNTDFCGRYGGEEFLLVYTQTNTTGSFNSAERLRCKIESMRFPDIGPDFRITVSLGLTEYHQNDDVQKVIERADSALYLAKRSGRNRVEFSG